ncbi:MULTISPECIES: hydroxyisourate hydrolase [Sphingomonas]|uniref:hydroxyisourate hydrolase n=1 Tax=Sphingomonas TaxID=13687 RepID=UPI0020C7A109|nr:MULTISPECIES: hydroxyisourate hydrolase [Sphingomonas]MCP8891389.1 hydroxyisourate hydrolase [Sphingomonas faeni]
MRCRATRTRRRRHFLKIDLVFRVNDPAAHYHVPVMVSPCGYSTLATDERSRLDRCFRT